MGRVAWPSSCSRNGGGDQLDDLLCSRNARPPKALVGRAQWKIISPHPLEEKMSELGEITSRYGIVQVRVVEGRLGCSSSSETHRYESCELCSLRKDSLA